MDTSDNELGRLSTTFVSIFDCSPAHADVPTGEWIAALTLGLPDGEVQVLTFSWKDALFLAEELRLSFAHVEERDNTSGNKAKPPAPVPEPEAPIWTPPTIESARPKKQFVSDLRPTGLTLRRWVDEKLQVYSILGGYALPDPGHYILLCRHGARPKHDSNMLVVQDGEKLMISVADDHPIALKRQPYMWRWFENWGTRKPVKCGDPLVNVRKLSMKALKALLAAEQK